MEEIFKEVKNFEGLYLISNKGTIKSLRGYRGVTLMKTQLDKYGYECVTLRDKDSKKYIKYIHRMVAEAYIPNPDGLPCVNHKDENKQNNFVWVNPDGSVDLEKSNLEWCTPQYNNEYGTRNERLKRNAVEKLAKRVRQKRGDIIYGEYESIAEAARQNYLCPVCIGKSCHHEYTKDKTNIYAGYEWEFID